MHKSCYEEFECFGPISNPFMVLGEKITLPNSNAIEKSSHDDFTKPPRCNDCGRVLEWDDSRKHFTCTDKLCFNHDKCLMSDSECEKRHPEWFHEQVRKKVCTYCGEEIAGEPFYPPHYAAQPYCSEACYNEEESDFQNEKQSLKCGELDLEKL